MYQFILIIDGVEKYSAVLNSNEEYKTWVATHLADLTSVEFKDIDIKVARL